MKVALVKNHCSLRGGGSERYCANLARGLIAPRHEVTVIGRSMDAELRDELRAELRDELRSELRD